MRVQNRNGYSEQVYQENGLDKAPKYLLIGQGPVNKYKWIDDLDENGNPQKVVRNGREVTKQKVSDEIDKTQVQIYFLGIEATWVSLPAGYKLPKDITDLNEIELIEPQAVEVNGNLYIKANGLQAV